RAGLFSQGRPTGLRTSLAGLCERRTRRGMGSRARTPRFGIRCTDEEVAAFFGVSTRTIKRRRKVEEFRDIMDQGRAKGRVSVRRSLFKLANAGNIAAAIFLSKN